MMEDLLESPEFYQDRAIEIITDYLCGWGIEPRKELRREYTEEQAVDTIANVLMRNVDEDPEWLQIQQEIAAGEYRVSEGYCQDTFLEDTAQEWLYDATWSVEEFPTQDTEDAYFALMRNHGINSLARTSSLVMTEDVIRDLVNRVIASNPEMDASQIYDAAVEAWRSDFESSFGS